MPKSKSLPTEIAQLTRRREFWIGAVACLLVIGLTVGAIAYKSMSPTQDTQGTPLAQREGGGKNLPVVKKLATTSGPIGQISPTPTATAAEPAPTQPTPSTPTQSSTSSDSQPEPTQPVEVHPAEGEARHKGGPPSEAIQPSPAQAPSDPQPLPILEIIDEPEPSPTTEPKASMPESEEIVVPAPKEN